MFPVVIPVIRGHSAGTGQSASGPLARWLSMADSYYGDMLEDLLSASVVSFTFTDF